MIGIQVFLVSNPTFYWQVEERISAWASFLTRRSCTRQKFPLLRALLNPASCSIPQWPRRCSQESTHAGQGTQATEGYRKEETSLSFPAGNPVEFTLCVAGIPCREIFHIVTYHCIENQNDLGVKKGCWSQPLFQRMLMDELGILICIFFRTESCSFKNDTTDRHLVKQML